MDGIVSLLDDRHRDMVLTLWEELRGAFGLRGIYPTRFPHFSYHVAERYDAARLTPILAEFGQSHSPFHVTATGLGIFTGPQPVLYVPLVRTPELSLVHQDLWLALDGTAEGTTGLYHPRKWIPHITLAHGDISNEVLPDVIRFLRERSFNWDFKVDDVTLVIQAGTLDERQERFRLGASVDAGFGTPRPEPG
jgi:2'-5' RNA ligase